MALPIGKLPSIKHRSGKACISSPFIIAAYKAGLPTATITPLVQVADSCPWLHTSAGLISSVGATIVQGHSFYFFGRMDFVLLNTSLQNKAILSHEMPELRLLLLFQSSSLMHTPLETAIAGLDFRYSGDGQHLLHQWKHNVLIV